MLTRCASSLCLLQGPSLRRQRRPQRASCCATVRQWACATVRSWASLRSKKRKIRFRYPRPHHLVKERRDLLLSLFTVAQLDRLKGLANRWEVAYNTAASSQGE